MENIDSNNEDNKSLNNSDTGITVGNSLKAILKKKYIIIFIIILLVLIFAGIIFTLTTSYKSSVAGVVEGYIIKITPETAGKVANLYVSDKQEVKQNQLLLEIESSDYRAKLRLAENRLSAAKAKLGAMEKRLAESSSKVKTSMQNLNAVSANLDAAEKDYTKSAEMYKEGIISKQEYDKNLNLLIEAQADKKSADENYSDVTAVMEADKAQVKSLEAGIKKFEAEAAQAKINLSKTKIYAPEDGVISVGTLVKGSYVRPEQFLFSLVPQRVWVVAKLKESANVKQGQAVLISAGEYPNKNFKGHIDSFQTIPSPDVRDFNMGSPAGEFGYVTAKILFDEDLKGFTISPGMSVSIKIR